MYDMRYRLLDEDVKEVKRLYWEGCTQLYAATVFNVSQATIYRIVKGDQRSEVPWPDGSIGGLPDVRRIELAAARIIKKREIGVPTVPEIEAREEILSTVKTVKERAERTQHGWRERVETLGQDIESEMDKDLKGAISVEGTPDETDPQISTDVTYEKADWEEILFKAKRNALVIYAVEDETFREAICVVFKSFPEEDWNTSWAARLAKQISRDVFSHTIEVEFKMKDGTA